MAHTVTGTKIILTWAIVAIYLTFILSHLASHLKTLGKWAVLVLSDTKLKRWEKIGNVGLESHSQIHEQTRIQDPAQFIGKKQTLKDNRSELESHIHKVMLLKQNFSF